MKKAIKWLLIVVGALVALVIAAFLEKDRERSNNVAGLPSQS